MKNLSLIFFLFSFQVFLLGDDKKIEIGIDEQLGKNIPLQLEFTDETGNKVILKDLIRKPTVLTFVYYECPAICSPLLLSVAEIINRSELKPGEDYNIVSLSFDERENFNLASEKKRNYLNTVTKDFPSSSWKFLTGDSTDIKKLTDACGFYFKREDQNFIHSGALIFISGDGKITRYLFPGYSDSRGYSIMPFDFKMAVLETSKGNTTPTIARMLQFCFSYDPEGKSYVLNFTRIFGAGILFLAAIFIVYLVIPRKKESYKR
jgi:protein SCO1/2